MSNREILVYLAGLLATDGSVIKTGKTSLRFRFSSTDEKFIKEVEGRLKSIEIRTTLRFDKIPTGKIWQLELLDPFKIYKLLKDNVLEYLRPEQRRRILEGYKGGERHCRWSEKESSILCSSQGKLSYQEIKDRLNGRSISAIRNKVIVLKRLGEIENIRWSVRS